MFCVFNFQLSLLFCCFSFEKREEKENFEISFVLLFYAAGAPASPVNKKYKLDYISKQFMFLSIIFF
jgi:hypothetical protein